MRYFQAQRDSGRDADRGRSAADRHRAGGRRCTCGSAPGSDAALANGLAARADARRPGRRRLHRGAHRRASRRCAAVATAYWPERVERMTGVPQAAIVETARMLGRAPHARWSSPRAGPEQQAQGVANALAFINLALALGLPGPRRQRLRLPDRARATARAGASTARRPTSSPAIAGSTTRGPRAHRRGLGRRPEAAFPARPLRLRDARRLGADGGVRALLVFGSNPAVSAPDGHARRRAAARARLAGRRPTSSSPRPRSSRTSCCPPRSGPRKTGP